MLLIIEIFWQYKYLIGIAVLKKFKLLNVDFLPKLKIEKCHNSIKLIKVKMSMGYSSKNSLVYYWFYHRSINLKIINLILLLKIAYFLLRIVLLDITINVFLLFKALFNFQYMIIFWAIYKTQDAICYESFLLNFHSLLPFVYFILN